MTIKTVKNLATIRDKLEAHEARYPTFIIEDVWCWVVDQNVSLIGKFAKRTASDINRAFRKSVAFLKFIESQVD